MMKLFAHRYKPLRLVGTGGFCRVFAVEDVKTGATRAFKWIVGNDDASRELALTEFSILQSLQHPHIAKIHEVGLSVESGQEQMYLVSEWIDGIDLLTALPTLNRLEIQKIFGEALQGLAYIHENGIRHGDIKPQNLLVTNLSGAPTLKIIDFGLAQTADETLAALKGGTLEYMAPEIFSDHVYSEQTDIYALGICFYKALTGRFPEECDATSLIGNHADLPAGFGAIIAKMIAADPLERYPHVEAILKDFDLAAQDSVLDKNASFLNFAEPFFLRKKEKDQWLQIYRDRFFCETKTTQPVVVVWGEKHAGKSHFLKDCLQMASLDLIQIISLCEFQNLNSFDELPEKALIWAEDTTWDEETVSYYETFFADRPFLFLATCSRKNKFLRENQQIQMQFWSEAQVESYLIKASGQKELPIPFVKTFFEKTGGAPQLLEESLKQMFAHGYLRGDTGKWSAKALEDLAGLIEPLQDEIAKIKSPQQNPIFYDEHGQLLTDAALTEKAKRLRQSGFLYETKTLLCDLYQRSHAANTRHSQLALEIASLDLEMGQIQTARELLTNCLCETTLNDESRILALELLSICDFREHRFESSALILQEALVLYERLAPQSSRCLEISLKSRLAHSLWHSGDKANAEELLQTTWTSWQNELSDDEKLQTLKINIDELYYQKGDYKKALACLNEQFDVVCAHPHLEAYAITLYKMARVHVKLKHWEMAEEKLLLSLHEMKKRRSLQWLSHVYNELGILFKQKNDLENSLINYRHAFELQRICKKDVSLFLIAQNLGSLYWELQNHTESEKFFLYAQKHLATQTANALAQRSLALCHLGLGQIEIARRNFAFANLHLQNAFKCLQKFKLEPLWQTYWQIKGTLDFAENNVLALQEDFAKLKHLQSLETFDHATFTKWQTEVLGQRGSAP